jgi:hypothetical protein
MKLRAGVNITVFLLFFGMALLEAFQEHQWIKAGLWVLGGFLFLAADNLRSKDKEKPTGS